MRNLQLISRGVQIAFLAAFVWATSQASVFAAGPGGSASEGGGAWVWAYMVVVLVLSLGMIVVCKSSNRRDTAKPVVYEIVKKTLLKD